MSKEFGEVLKGKVTSITKFGAFVSLPESKSGMIHISEIADGFVKDINDFLKVGQEVKVVVCSVDPKGRIALSLKKANEGASPKNEEIKKNAPKRTIPEPIPEKKCGQESFEDMMSKFMKTSNEKISDLRKVTDSKISSPGFSRKNSKKY